MQDEGEQKESPGRLLSSLSQFPNEQFLCIISPWKNTLTCHVVTVDTFSEPVIRFTLLPSLSGDGMYVKRVNRS